jgi:NAD(P)-dependent dehydrogenase (short-subunit alcohol dehydrogenase family)
MANPSVVVIVGGSSGIGRATAAQLAGAGNHLVLAARGRARLERTANECRESGAASVRTHSVDVRDRAAVERLVAEVLESYGRIDAVVHAAGVVAYGRFEDIPPEIFDAVLATNVTGAVNVARAVLPHLRERRQGTLVLIGSVLGDIAVPWMSPYVLSKYAIRALGRELALENRDLPDVRISVVSPGSVDTPIYEQAANYLGPVGKPPWPVATPAKVARTIVRQLRRPHDRVSVGVANPVMRLGFSAMPWVFDALVGPLMRALGQRSETSGPWPGSVLEPIDEVRDQAGTRSNHG